MLRFNVSRPLHVAFLVALVGAAAMAPACGSDAPPAAPEPLYVAPADVSEPVSGSFKITVDPAHPALQTTHREPQVGPVTVTGGNSDMEIVGHAKTISIRPDTIWVDLYIFNKKADGLADLEATLTSSGTLFDLSEDPLSEQPITGKIRVGGAAAEGVAHVTLGVPAAGPALTIDLALDGKTTKRRVSTSSPVQMTPDGKEAWVAFPDGDVIAVIDTATDKRVAQIPVPGRPENIAITNDGARVLVTSVDKNTVTVIDRESREVLQTLDEAAGIGREPRHIVTSPDGAHAYVSAYVGDRITALDRLENGKFRVGGTLQVGRRPSGMSVSADGQTLLVSHFLPRGKVGDNESWVSVVRTNPLALDHEAIIRDDANLKETKCLADVFMLPAADMEFEGVNTQLAGVFLDPGGNMGWIPALRFGPIPVWEVPIGVEIPGVNVTLFAPPFTMYLNTRDFSAVEPKLHPGMIDPPDAKLDYMKCARLSFQTEGTVRQNVEGIPGEQLNTGAATPAGMNPLSDTGAARFIGFTRGGRRALVLSYLADEVLVTDAITQHPTSRNHLGADPSGRRTTPIVPPT